MIIVDLKQLKYYITIVEEGSISAAGKKLYMSQPPLSKQMQALEEELDTKLFKRGAKKIMLTESGKILYERAKTLLNLNYSIKEEIEELKEGNRGMIRLGVVSSAASLFINEYLAFFFKAYPNIRFEITEKNTYDLLSSLAKGELEAAIVRSPFETNLKTIPIKNERLVAFGDKKYFKDDYVTTLEEIVSNPYAIYTRWSKVIEPYFLKLQLPFKPNLIHSDARTGVSFALAKMGIAILPLSIIEEKNLRMVREIKNLDIQSEIVFLYNEKGYQSEALSLFVNYLENKKALL